MLTAEPSQNVNIAIFFKNCLNRKKLRDLGHMPFRMLSAALKRLEIYLMFSLLLIAGGMNACTSPAEDPAKDILIRVGSQTATAGDFQQAFENIKSAYPHNSVKSAASLKNARLRLLNQMTEELLLLERAAALGIEISDSELNRALADIKKDYPGDVFDQMLLEYAVSYRIWEKRLKVRLLMEKVAAHELVEQIAITPEDVAAYYQKHYPKSQAGPEATARAKDIDELVVKRLRREKAEKKYQAWLKALQEMYPVEMNEAVWKEISG